VTKIGDSGVVKAVLGPTNTGKTHLAIERMCGHSSGMIGFPLRLLAREVYDRVCAIKGEKSVALITGEERIEPSDARYFCCTVEAMDRLGGGHAFVALDEAQLGADPERGHIFTDRLLHARGREETMLLGSATLEPMVRALIPRVEMVERPRFSTLSHIGSRKLSRLPPRSAVVAFSSEQVYAMAEMLRRFRGGAAVVMGALSPETRNKQVELFQNGDVDYIIATDAIGMGLNLDLHHIAFASLEKFDGRRKRRLTPSEMAQIAGRAGRHQHDGTFGTISGMKDGGTHEFTEEEVYAIEEHRFQPLTHLFWREAEPRFSSLGALIGDLEAAPDLPQLKSAPEAVDLAVLKRLAEEPLAHDIKGAGMVRRFWEACSLPDFRQVGPDTHARFVARLWQDLQEGYLGADFVAARIAELDMAQGDIATLQGRIAAIRSWAYICQRPDWVLARDEMAARARAVEARLSDALHARLTERFVNRRTAILMKSLGQDGSALPVKLEAGGELTVEGEHIGRLDGFRFTVDPAAGHADRKMLLSAAEKALPRLLAERAAWVMSQGVEQLSIEQGQVMWDGHALARVELPDDFTAPRLELTRDVSLLAEPQRTQLLEGLSGWVTTQLEPLAPLRQLAEAARDPEAGSEARAVLHVLIAGHGVVSREMAGLEHLPKEQRPYLRKLGVVFGALDIFARDLLKPAPRQLLHALGVDRRDLLKPAPRQLLHALGVDRRDLQSAMLPVIAQPEGKHARLPAGYRLAGTQAIRVDLAEKILRAAFEARQATAQKSDGGKPNRHFRLDLSLPISIGLEEGNIARLLGAAGFHQHKARALAEGAFGPPAPDIWNWRPRRTQQDNDRQGNRHRKPHGKQADGNRPDRPQNKHKQKGKPVKGKGRHGGPRNDRGNQREKKPDYGPARASGAFDALADLLR